MDVPDELPDVLGPGGVEGGFERAGREGEPEGWRAEYRIALDQLDLGVDDDAVLGALAAQCAGALKLRQDAWWRITDLSGLDDDAARERVYEALTGEPDTGQWDATKAVRYRHYIALAFARGWVISLRYGRRGELAIMLSAEGCRALNAYQRRLERPEFPD